MIWMQLLGCVREIFDSVDVFLMKIERKLFSGNLQFFSGPSDVRLVFLYFFFCLVAITGFIEIFYFNKDMFQNWGNLDLDPKYFSLSKKCFLLAVTFVVLKRSPMVLKSRGLVYYLAIYSFCVFFLIWRSFSLDAALGAFVKDLVPILLILLGFVYREYAEQALKAIVVIALLNNVAQLMVVYPVQQLGILGGRLPFSGSPVFRASGLMDVAVFEYLNFLSAVIALLFFKRRSLLWVSVFCLFGMLALQAKSIPIFSLVWLIAVFRRDSAPAFWRFIVIFLMFSAILIVLSFGGGGGFGLLGELFQAKVESNVKYLDSVRAISYFAAFNEIANGNLFGAGLGEFGGPQALLFQSPLYLKYVPIESQLITTDTYYPHVLVEWGLIGAVFYFSVLFLPLLRGFSSRSAFQLYLAVVGYILIGNAVTFAYEDLLRGFLVFPLLYMSTAIGREV